MAPLVLPIAETSTSQKKNVKPSSSLKKTIKVATIVSALLYSPFGYQQLKKIQRTIDPNCLAGMSSIAANACPVSNTFISSDKN